MIQARHLNTGSPLIPSCAAIKSRLPTKSHQEFNDNLQALIDVALRVIPSAPRTQIQLVPGDLDNIGNESAELY